MKDTLFYMKEKGPMMKSEKNEFKTPQQKTQIVVMPFNESN
jgi:hypothetical protein